MDQTGCCGFTKKTKDNCETIQIEKTKATCGLCEDYAKTSAQKPVAVMCCEGACLRGEIARQAANKLCHSLSPESTTRICLGGAFTKDTGQRNLVRAAKRVIAVEGCVIRCASRMMAGVIPGLKPEVVLADKLYDFNRDLFGINEMPKDEIERHADTVAKKLEQMLLK